MTVITYCTWFNTAVKIMQIESKIIKLAYKKSWSSVTTLSTTPLCALSFKP